MNHLEQFVFTSTSMYDESHDYGHAVAVRDTARQIASTFPEETGIDKIILDTAAMVHDVCDHKYINKGSISEKELVSFLEEYLKDHLGASLRVMNIVNCVSWSKQEKGTSTEAVNLLSELDKIHLDIVRDADRIMAIGVENGIRRCKAYAFAMQKCSTEEAAMNHVIEHCQEKLLRLYPENFIVTEEGRKSAKPLHDEIKEWFDKNLWWRT